MANGGIFDSTWLMIFRADKNSPLLRSKIAHHSLHVGISNEQMSFWAVLHNWYTSLFPVTHLRFRDVRCISKKHRLSTRVHKDVLQERVKMWLIMLLTLPWMRFVMMISGDIKLVSIIHISFLRRFSLLFLIIKFFLFSRHCKNSDQTFRSVLHSIKILISLWIIMSNNCSNSVWAALVSLTDNKLNLGIK